MKLLTRTPLESSARYIFLKQELDEARLALETVKRAWREEHDARVEAEEARDAVTMAAEEARAEAEEARDEAVQKRKDLEFKVGEIRRSARQVLEAKRLYERAKASAEEARRVWSEASRAAKAGRRYDSLKVEAQVITDQSCYAEASASKRIMEVERTLERVMS